MPKFSQEPIEVKKPGRPAGIPQEVIDEYKGYIEQIEKGYRGTLEFKNDENINQARKALVQAGEESKNYVKVRKPRGAENVLQFERITRKEYVAAKQSAAARGAKLKKALEAKPKAKVKGKKKN